MCDDRTADHIKYLVKKLTTTGKEDLDESVFKKLKSICKSSDSNVIKLHELLFLQFKKKHAEIRLSCFAICDQIFQRSHCFRCLILDDFPVMTNLIFGTDSKKEKLLPVNAAKKLKSKAICAFKDWERKYGQAYRTLTLLLDHCEVHFNVDFVHMTTLTPAEREAEELERQLADEKKQKKITKIQNEMEDLMPELRDDLTAFKNCFNLLIPNVDNFFIPLTDDEMDEKLDLFTEEETSSVIRSEEDDQEMASSTHEVYGSDYVRSTGILKGTTVKIDLTAIKVINETNDNQFILNNLKELLSVLEAKWLPKVKQLLQSILPYSEGNADIIKQLIQMKDSLQSAINVFTSITIIPLKKDKPLSIGNESASKCTLSSNSSQGKLLDDSDTDEDFLEVTEADPRVASAINSEAQLLGLLQESTTAAKLSDWSLDSGACSSSSTTTNISSKIENLKDLHNSTSISGSEDSVQSVAITRNTSSSLKGLTPESFNSGEWTPPVMYVNPLAGLSQVWLNSSNIGQDDDDCDSDTVSSSVAASSRTCGLLGLATCPVNIDTPFEEVRWQCRAPLPSGRLCPRRDRFKCPLHGRVLPRSASSGRPDLEYAERLLLQARGQDPVQAEPSAAGVACSEACGVHFGATCAETCGRIARRDGSGETAGRIASDSIVIPTSVSLSETQTGDTLGGGCVDRSAASASAVESDNLPASVATMNECEESSTDASLQLGSPRSSSKANNVEISGLETATGLVSDEFNDDCVGASREEGGFIIEGSRGADGATDAGGFLVDTTDAPLNTETGFVSSAANDAHPDTSDPEEGSVQDFRDEAESFWVSAGSAATPAKETAAGMRAKKRARRDLCSKLNQMSGELVNKNTSHGTSSNECTVALSNTGMIDQYKAFVDKNCANSAKFVEYGDRTDTEDSKFSDTVTTKGTNSLTTRNPSSPNIITSTIAFNSSTNKSVSTGNSVCNSFVKKTSTPSAPVSTTTDIVHSSSTGYFSMNSSLATNSSAEAPSDATAQLSVSAAERLVSAVKAALERDRRQRMNLDHDWQDPVLLADIRAATGVDLDMRNARRRSRDCGGLTDLKKHESTPRYRLAQRVMSRRATHRLNRALAKH